MDQLKALGVGCLVIVGSLGAAIGLISLTSKHEPPSSSSPPPAITHYISTLSADMMTMTDLAIDEAYENKDVCVCGSIRDGSSVSSGYSGPIVTLRSGQTVYTVLLKDDQKQMALTLEPGKFYWFSGHTAMVNRSGWTIENAEILGEDTKKGFPK